MPEYRYNIITNRWVIIAAGRNQRPCNFSRNRKNPAASFLPDCPFCPGNEQLTPPETFALRPGGGPPDSGGWLVRVVPNKYPFLGNDKQTPPRYKADISFSADGHHEVLIESTGHNQHFARHTPNQANLIINSLRKRYRDLTVCEDIKHIAIFCNHGPAAGASLSHPHFQIAASCFVAPHITRQLHYCREYFQKNQRSVFSDAIAREQADSLRIIGRNRLFIAFCPYAAMCPLEVYIIPLVEQPQFGWMTDDMIPELAHLLQTVLQKLNHGMNDPDYNLVIHTAPVDHPPDDVSLRWFIQLFPRTNITGGYELATDVYINPLSPESAAEFYRQA